MIRWSRYLFIQWIISSIIFAAIFAYSQDKQSADKTNKLSASKIQKVIKANNSKLIKQLKENLAKIEVSIKITKERMNNPQEIQFLPDLYLMLAEMYSEKSKYMYSLKIESNLNAPKDELDFTAEKRVKQDAIENYISLIDRFPNNPNLDKASFALAHEYRELGDLDNALKYYKQIIERFPNSETWVESQLIIGNIYFEKKDFEFAIEQYKKVLVKNNLAMSSAALYKMATSYIYLDQFLNSMLTFDKLMKMNKVDSPNIEDFKKVDIREEALVASVWPLTELKAEDIAKYPEFTKPMQYYKNVSFDKASYKRVLSRLARRLSIKKRYAESSMAWFEVLKLSEDASQSREAMENFYLEKKQSKKIDFPTTAGREVANALRKLKNENLDYLKYEALLRDIATSSHKNAMKTKRKEDLLLAINNYRDYLWIIEKSKYNAQMQVNMAEAFYHAQEFVESGKLYLELANRVKNPKRKKDFLDSSIQSFVEAFKNINSLSPLDKLQSRTSFRLAANQFIKNYPKDKNISKISYNLGKSLYDEQKYDDAIVSLRSYLKKFPSDENALKASLLILDSYYVRDDMKSLLRESKSLITKYALSANIKKEIQSVADQAQLKNVRSIAGDFDSKNYAAKFLEFAKKNKNSNLGETALLEAFESLKANNDFAVFDVGSQYIAQFSNSPKAKDIMLSMAQLALVTADYRRAATYLMAYAQKFPNESNANEYAKQAASLFEQLGDTEDAFESYLTLNDNLSAARVLFHAGDWKKLNSFATKLNAIEGLFYQGISAHRLKKSEEAIGLLRRAFLEKASTEEQSAMRAHSGFLIAEYELKEFKKMGLNTDFTPTLLKQKITSLQNFDLMMQEVINLGVGRWTIASMAMMGLAHAEFVSFLQDANPPNGMKPEQLAKILDPKIAEYKKSSLSFFNQCTVAAEKFDVFTRFVRTCQSNGKLIVNESEDTRLLLKASNNVPKEAEQVRKKLYENPRDLISLQKLVSIYMKAKDYPTAFVIMGRIFELEPNTADFVAQQAMIQIYMNQLDQAFLNFKKAISMDANDLRARLGLYAMFKKFSFNTKAKSISLPKDIKLDNGILHPWVGSK